MSLLMYIIYNFFSLAGKGVMDSPEYIQTSLAAAISLGLEKGRFKDGIKLTGLNLLLVYGRGCIGRCAYCGLSKVPDAERKGKKTFIRVKWPIYKLDEIIRQTCLRKNGFQRICVSMITHRNAVGDTIRVTRRLKDKIDLPVSLLISPTVIKDISVIKEFRRAGADMVGIAIDAATPGLFRKYRGDGVGGPHIWDRYWEVLRWSVEVFGKFKAGVHLICGLGETEREMVYTIYRAHMMGAKTHLFAFYPEAYSQMEAHPRPGLESYRRVQIAAYLINQLHRPVDAMRFGPKGNICSFDCDLEEVIGDGYAFMTSGCPGDDPRIAACNRPLANERPSEAYRNYPYVPSARDKEIIKGQIKSLWTT